MTDGPDRAPRERPRARLPFLVLVAVLAVAGAAAGLLAGCGGDDRATTGASTSAMQPPDSTPAAGDGEPQSGAAKGLTVGIGEQGAAMFDHPLFLDLGVRHARLVAAYDATQVDFEREIVDVWLAAAERRGIEPFVTLSHSRKRPDRLPSVAEFRARFREFHRRWPQVRAFAAWNEANHKSQPTHDAPARAADFHDVVREECDGCTVVAGDLLDQEGMTRYLAEYRRHLDAEPEVWGLHNYADTNRFRRSGLRRLLARVEGDVWLTETGGLYRFGRNFPPSARRQARAVAYTFRLARSSDRVRRVYLYNWTGAAPDARFDAGLVGPDGQPRPAYDVVRRALVR